MKAPETPVGLSPEQAAIWTETVPLVKVAWTPLRVMLLEAYVRERARWAEAEKHLAEHGDTLILRNERGEVTDEKPAPQLRIAQVARTESLKLAGRLGLNRSR